MLTEEQASRIVLDYLHSGRNEVKFVIQSASLAPAGDYWVIRANSEAAVVHNGFSQLYVGVNAYLVNVITGVIETVGSGQTVESYLQDKVDMSSAMGRHYVLASASSPGDSHAIIHLHQTIGCSLANAKHRISQDGHLWLTGVKRRLQWAKDELDSKGIPTEILLCDCVDQIPLLSENICFWENLQALLLKRFQA